MSHRFKFPSDLSIIRVTKESEIPGVLVDLLNGKLDLKVKLAVEKIVEFIVLVSLHSLQCTVNSLIGKSSIQISFRSIHNMSDPRIGNPWSTS